MNSLRSDVTALVLAGGRGSRMGGIDKGWAPYRGVPLITHVLSRLVPQVSAVLVNANRSVSRYQRLGWPVLHDADPTAFDGPLAGMLAGLRACETPWLLTAPCDSPFVPTDYAGRMVSAAEDAGASVAMASDGDRHQPVFCLLHRDRVHSLTAYLANGDRKIDLWTRAEGAIEVVFRSETAFRNFNTASELRDDDTP
ncbi:MAG: molybdenum cofactor guanylyltransferase MobA [Pseudomonadota bacterium]